MKIKNLLHIFSGYFLGVTPKHNLKTPHVLGEYSTVKVLLKERLSDTCVLKIKDKNNKLYVAKVWQGEAKNYSYDSLYREYQCYKILHKAIKKYNLNNKSSITIPKVFKFVDNGDMAYLVIEYISGKTLEKYNSAKTTFVLSEVNNFFEKIGKLITENDLKIISERSYLYHTFSYPLFLTKSLINNHSKCKVIIKAFFRFIVSIAKPKVEKVLLHGDLNLENIILKGNLIYPIDFQFVNFGIKEYGLANTLRYVWGKKDYRDMLIKYIRQGVKDGMLDGKLFSSLIIIHGTQGLMAKNFSKKDILSISDYLENAPTIFYKVTPDIKSFLYKIFSIFDIFSTKKSYPMVLCYHSFSSNTDRYSISVNEFEKQIKRMSAKYKFISYKQLFTSESKNGVLITIDDGLKSVLKILPITKKYKIPVLLFVLSNPSKANREELDTKEEMLNRTDIKFLIDNGWSIGSHSATHADFSNLQDSLVVEEVVQSKKIIEKDIGSKVDCFAYPKGALTPKIYFKVKKAMYRNAFSILPGRVTKDTDKFSIPRTVIDDTHKSTDFPYLFSVTWLKIREITSPLKLWERFIA